MSGYDQFFKDVKKAKGAPKFNLTSKNTPRPTKSDGRSPEDYIREELTARMKQKKNKALRPKQKFPVFPAVVTVVAFAACAVGYFKPDLVDGVMSRVEFGVFGHAQAEEKKADAKSDQKTTHPSPGEKAAATKDPKAEKTAANGAVAKAEDVPDVKNWTEEELSFFKKLNERKKELDLREAELTRLEEELQKQKLELDGKIKKLEGMRSEISQTLKTRVATDQEKVDKLVQFYSTMKAQQAAKVIESLNEDLAVEVLDKMKKKNAAEIMNMMDAKKARRLSELLTGYERTPASAKEQAAADDAKDE